jgi:hypothetical protein
MRDDDLDKLLAMAAKTPPPSSAGLMARVLADAEALQPRPGVTIALPPALPPVLTAPGVAAPGLLSRLADLLGGAPGLAGVAGAAVLGFALGYLNPAALSALGTAISAETEALDLFPTTDFLTTEG